MHRVRFILILHAKLRNISILSFDPSFQPNDSIMLVLIIGTLDLKKQNRRKAM